MFPIKWSDDDKPHFVIEVNQRCSIRCQSCYKSFTGATHSLADLKASVDEALRRRQRVQLISLAGGEPLLHPEIEQLVRYIHGRGLHSAVMTNGLLATPERLQQLAQAGLDAIVFHVDDKQKRADLPPSPTVEDVQALLDKLIDAAAAVGLDAGLSWVISPDTFSRFRDMVEYFLRKKEASIFLATHLADVEWFIQQGNEVKQLGKSYQEVRRAPTYADRTNNRMVYELLDESFGLEPFAFLPGSDDGRPEASSWQWMSYTIPVIYKSDGKYSLFRVRSGLGDRLLLKLIRLLKGQYLFYVPQNRATGAVQVALNGLFARRPFSALAFLSQLGKDGATMRVKRLGADNGLYITPKGEVECTKYCPNETIRDGRIVPVCLADHLPGDAANQERAA